MYLENIILHFSRRKKLYKKTVFDILPQTFMENCMEIATTSHIQLNESLILFTIDGVYLPRLQPRPQLRRLVKEPRSLLLGKEIIFKLYILNCIFLRNLDYLERRIVDAFYAYESLTVRPANSLLCGICGIIPDVLLGKSF